MTTTWNPADLVNITLSGGNLVATSTGAGAVRSLISAGVFKYYYEDRFTTAGSSAAVGIVNAAATLSNVIATGVGSAQCTNSGVIAVNGTGQTGIGALGAGGTCCIAFDMAAKVVWFRNGAAGNWNGSGTANPATGVGGYSFSGLTGGSTTIHALAGGTSVSSSVTTANFGATAYVGTPPSGFVNIGDVPVTGTAVRAMVLA
jgi:hypothetical protein